MLRSLRSSTCHRCGNAFTNTFGGSAGLTVVDMRIAQGHGRARVSEHSCNRRQWNTSCHRLARHRMPEVVHAHFVDPCFFSCSVPEAENITTRHSGIARRRKDIGTPGPGLARDDGLRSNAQPDCPSARLRFVQLEHGPVHLGPLELQYFAFSAAGQKQQADDISLWLSGRPFFDKPVQSPAEPADFFRRQEPCHLFSRILPDSVGRIAIYISRRNRGIHDLTKQCQRFVGRAGRRPAVVVEPAFDISPPDRVEGKAAKGRWKLPPDQAINALSPRRFVSVAACCLPFVHDEFPQDGTRGTVWPAVGIARMRAVVKFEAFRSGFLDRREFGRANSHTHRCAGRVLVPDIASLAGRTHPHA